MDNVTAQITPPVQTQQQDASYVDAYMPPPAMGDMPPAPAAEPAPAFDTVPTITSPAPPVQQVAPTPSQNKSEELEDQNIFTMLGVTDGTAEQRESFLDELQQVIWEDFLEYDVKLLITAEEQTQLSAILSETTGSELEKQEKIVVFLEKLVPDLEEIMLEKALELKQEMMRERVKGMREYYANKPEALTQIEQAENHMNAGKWYSAAVVLNGIR